MLEWDQLFPFAAAAVNWFSNEHSQESPNFLYFGCDPYVPHLAVLLQPKLYYLGSDKGMIHLDKLRQAYMVASLNTREAQSKQPRWMYDDFPNYKIGDLVMLKNLDGKSTWDAKYVPNFRVVYVIDQDNLKFHISWVEPE